MQKRAYIVLFLTIILTMGFASPTLAVTVTTKPAAKSIAKSKTTAPAIKTVPGAKFSLTEGQFTDAERNNRVIPYRLYIPKRATRPAPVVIFSHGLGGSTGAAAYLGTALAENGYYAFHIQHPGSDKSVWDDARSAAKIKKELRDAVKDPATSIDRYNDLPFVIDQIELLNAEGTFKNRFDMSRIGFAGHSYGGRSVMAAAGERAGPDAPSFKDDRVRAGIVLSPNVPVQFMKNSRLDLTNDFYADIDIPLFHVTGTADEDPLGLYGRQFDPVLRTVPFSEIDTSDQYLLVLDGADHASFGAGRNTGKDYGRYQDAVSIGATLFFDAYLKGDELALETLQEGFPKTLAPADTFKHK